MAEQTGRLKEAKPVETVGNLSDDGGELLADLGRRVSTRLGGGEDEEERDREEGGGANSLDELASRRREREERRRRRSSAG